MAQTTKPRLIFLIDSLGMGGAERLLTIYLEHFDLVPFSPRVCALQIRDENPIGQHIEKLGIPVDLMPLTNLRQPHGLPSIIRYLRQQQADILHTQLEFSDTLGSIAARVVGIPTVSTLHTFDAPEAGTRTYWRLKLRWWILRKFCSRIVAVSEGTRQHHMQVGGLPADKVVTLYNGIDLARFRSAAQATDPAQKRAELGIPPDAQVLTTVAVLRKPKGLQYFIPALPKIFAAVPQAHYLVVGDGQHGSELKKLVELYGVADKVTFVGTRNDIPELLAASDIFVLPTLGEALPTVLAEAMAVRKPIVVSRVGGVPEMIDDGENGLLVRAGEPAELAEACLQLLQNPARAQQMGQTGGEIVEKRFNVRRQVQRLGELYQNLLNGQSS